MVRLRLLTYLNSIQEAAATESAPAGTLENKNVQGVIKCTWCGRLRCVYVKVKLSAVTRGAPEGSNLKHVLQEALEANRATYTCGSDLDLRGFDGALTELCRPYVRMKLDCSHHVELQLYSSQVLPAAQAKTICGYCGDEGHLRQNEDEAGEVLPVCQPCYEQHRKARPSGRQRTGGKIRSFRVASGPSNGGTAAPHTSASC